MTERESEGRYGRWDVKAGQKPIAHLIYKVRPLRVVYLIYKVRPFRVVYLIYKVNDSQRPTPSLIVENVENITSPRLKVYVAP